MMLPVLTVLIDVWEPGDPVPAPRPRVHPGGAHYPRRYNDYRAALRLAFMVDRSKRGSPPRYKGPVRVTMAAHVLRAGDVDNYAKTALDALSGVVIADDRQVMELHALLVPGSPTGLHITVETMGS